MDEHDWHQWDLSQFYYESYGKAQPMPVALSVDFEVTELPFE